MKNMLIRILAIALFATSISAFAESGKPKAGRDPKTKTPASEAKPAPCAAAQQNDQLPACVCQTQESREKAQRQNLIEQQDQQWLHDIQYISPGL